MANPPRTTVERGYGEDHRRLRELWKPLVEGGDVKCHAAICRHDTRWLMPWDEWHLGHTPDRTAWTGPEHADCNTSEAGRRGNPRASQPATAPRWRPTRQW